MRRDDWVIVGKLTLVYALINSSILLCIYFFGWPILQRWYVSLFILAGSLGLIGHLFKTLIETESPKNSFLVLSVTIAVCFLSSTITTASIHHYLDPNYKYELARLSLQKRLEKIREVEAEKNVKMDIDEETEKNAIIHQYSLERIGVNYLLSVPVAFVLAWLILSFTTPKDSSY